MYKVLYSINRTAENIICNIIFVLEMVKTLIFSARPGPWFIFSARPGPASNKIFYFRPVSARENFLSSF